MGGQMSFMSDADRAALTVERLIFHVLQPKKPLKALAEIRPFPVQYEEFFLERVRAVLDGGIRFRFESTSPTKASLLSIKKNPKGFAAESVKLADRFNQLLNSDAMLPGVFLTIVLGGASCEYYALIKYDNEQVVQYEVGANGKSVLLKLLNDTFVKSRAAMQKCALVRLGDDPQLRVHDRSNPAEATEHFKTFLGVRREQDRSELTKRMQAVLRETVRAHVDELPDRTIDRVAQQFRATALSVKKFDPERAVEFLTAIVGPIPDGCDIAGTFAHRLQKFDMDEPFQFHGASLPRARRTRWVTKENIHVLAPNEHEGLVRVAEGEIVISTSGNVEHFQEDDVALRLNLSKGEE